MSKLDDALKMKHRETKETSRSIIKERRDQCNAERLREIVREDIKEV